MVCEQVKSERDVQGLFLHNTMLTDLAKKSLRIGENWEEAVLLLQKCLLV